MPAAEMKQKWELMSGNSRIARNYINEEDDLAVVKFVEDMVVRMYIDDLKEAHREAIKLTVRKFELHPQFQSSSLFLSGADGCDYGEIIRRGSPHNLKYMRAFVETYSKIAISQRCVG